MTRHLYDGVAALRLIHDEDLRNSKNPSPHIITLKVLIDHALDHAQEDPEAAASSVEVAGIYAARLSRELKKIAKAMKDAAELERNGFEP